MRSTHYTVNAPLNLNIALVSDLHCYPYKEVLERVGEEKPDIIAVPGDIMENTANHSVTAPFNQPGFAFLSALTAIAPVYYSIGNHEGGMSEENRTLLKEAGITLLDNAFLHAHGLCIGGLTSPLPYEKHHAEKTPSPNLEFLSRFANEQGFHLLLSHHPEHYPAYIRSTGVELIVSGHAHGGQWRIFGKDIYAPGQGLFPKYASGMHENRLIVGRGLANTVFPIPRLGNPTEAVFIHLRRGES
ncbi:MAG: metallophosphoesterase [Clostridia bacterium]|nr:metallophosphoesterase [Clostridia bacterium]